MGVGTTDPNFLIEAAGANSEIALNSTSGSIYRVRSTSSDAFIITKNGVGDRLVIDGAGNATFAGDLVVDTDTLFVDASEDSVGINTANPSSYTKHELVVTAPDEGGVTIASGTDEAAYLAFADSTTSPVHFIRVDHDTDAFQLHSRSTFSFQILEGVEVLGLNDVGGGTAIFAGNVGITGKTPAYGLNLAQGTGSGNKIAWTDGAPNFAASIYADSSTDKLTFATKNASNVETTALEIDISQNAIFAGNVRISKTDATLEINNSTGSLTNADLYISVEDTGQADVRQYGAYPLAFWTNNVERMRIDSSGNLSLATATSLDFNVADFAQIKFRESGAITIDSDNDQSSRNFAIKDGDGTNLLTVFDTGNSTFAGNVLIDGVSNYTGLEVKGVGASRPQIKFSNANQGTLAQIYGTESNSLVTTVPAGLEYQVRNANGASGDHVFKSYNTAILTLNGGTNAATFSGNVAIGRTDARVRLEIEGAGQATANISDSGSGGAFIQASDTGNGVNRGGGILFSATNDLGTRTPQASIKSLLKNGNSQGVGDLAFSTRAATSDTTLTERMRITYEGQLVVGKSTSIGVEQAGFYVASDDFMSYTNASSDSGDRCLLLNRQQAPGLIVEFRTGNVTKGDISINSVGVNYNSTSDYRLKEDLKDFNGLDKVSKIPVYDFKWKTDESRSYGVMAHELQEVLPDAVKGDKDGRTNARNVDYGRISSIT